MLQPLIIWLTFIAGILLLILLDLSVLHRKDTTLAVRQAVGWWSVWVTLALLFNIYIYFLYENNWLNWGLTSIVDLNGGEAAIQFLTGYLLELSLSVDNVFVIAIIFQYMRIPAHLQYRVLFWGILGAILMRGIMIGAGAVLIMRFQWVSYIFGMILILSAARMLVLREEVDPEKGFVIRVARRFFPVTSRIDGRKFFTLENGKRAATPLFVTLLMVEYADLMFAVDSVPAIFAVTRDPFLIFTSNVFAILGLRTLYFAVSGMMHRFRYLKFSLVFILVYVGVKMMVAQHYHIPNVVSLAMIAGVLGVGIIASLWVARLENRMPHEGP